ncbi:hypothetical protein ABK040_005427 [Willaertia magna]
MHRNILSSFHFNKTIPQFCLGNCHFNNSFMKSNTFLNHDNIMMKHYSILQKRTKTKQKLIKIKDELPENEQLLFNERMKDLSEGNKVINEYVEKNLPDTYLKMKKSEGIFEILKKNKEEDDINSNNKKKKKNLLEDEDYLTDKEIKLNEALSPSNKKNQYQRLFNIHQFEEKEEEEMNEEEVNKKRISFKEMLTKEERFEITIDRLESIFNRTAKHSPKGSKVLKIAIVGNPNAGKSSILNYLTKRKISAVSPKTQTTRKRTLGVLNEDKYQLVVFDTPGLLNFKNTKMKVNKTARETISGLEDETLLTLGCADIILLMLDVTKPLKEIDHILDLIKKTKETILNEKKKGMILVGCINKCDMVDMNRAQEYRFELIRSGLFQDAIITSTRSGLGIESLKNYLKDNAIDRKWYFDVDVGATPGMTTADIVKEVIREKLYRCTDKEIPYQVDIIVKDLKIGKNESLLIDVDILTRTVGQKKVVINSIPYVRKYAENDLRKMYFYDIQIWFKVKDIN